MMLNCIGFVVLQVLAAVFYVRSIPVNYDSSKNELSALDDIIAANKGLDLFDIDIKIPDYNQHSHRARRSSPYKTTLWPGGVVPFVISPVFNGKPDHLKAIIDAIKEYNTRTQCVRLIERTDEEDFLSFEYHGGCWSYLGYIPSMRGQVISIGERCALKGTVLHEIKHALGFHHTHTRMDRDTYITINWNQLLNGSESLFYNEDEYHTNHGTYDKNSIMHYSSYAFAKDYSAKSIFSYSDYNEYLGQRVKLSDSDIQQLDFFYCLKATTTTTTTTTTTVIPTTTSTTSTTTTLMSTTTTSSSTPVTTTTRTPATTTATTTQSTSTPTTATSTTSVPITTTSTTSTTPITTTTTTSSPTTTAEIVLKNCDEVSHDFISTCGIQVDLCNNLAMQTIMLFYCPRTCCRVSFI